MSNSKIPNMARYFCNVVLAYLMFLQNFYDVQMPAYSVIWRHVKCIYKGIIDLRFEFVWPEIFHLSGKYFEKQLAGMCQMPHISPLIAMIESTKKWTWNFFMTKLSALSPRYEKNLQKKYILIQPNLSKVNNKLLLPLQKSCSKGDCLKNIILMILNRWFCRSFYLLTSSLQ